MKHTIANGLSISDSDVVNLDDFIPAGEYNPHNVHGWVLHEYGFVIAVVFASSLQDAFDIAVDKNKLDSFLITDEDLKDYGPEEDGVARLGNAGEPFDIENISVVELANPPASFVALLNAAKQEELP